MSSSLGVSVVDTPVAVAAAGVPEVHVRDVTW